jgi:acyl carrier protein
VLFLLKAGHVRAERNPIQNNSVRILIAHRLGVDVKSVTDEAHFTDDFGADWLDRLELMIEIEAQFRTVEFTDDDVDQIHVVGDLIRHVKSARVAKGDDASFGGKGFFPSRCV